MGSGLAMDASTARSFALPQFGSQLAGRFRDLLAGQDFHDVTLVAEDGALTRAHRVVLSGGSKFFLHLLPSLHTSHPVIFLKDISSSSLTSLLQLVYTGQVEVEEENLQAFIMAARVLKVQGMEDMEEEDREEEVREVEMEETVDEFEQQARPKRPRLEIEMSETEEEHEDIVIPVDDDDDDDDVKIMTPEEVNPINLSLEVDASSKDLLLNIETKNITNDFTKSGLPCKECVFCAKDMGDLKKHIVTVHKGLPCNNCGNRFGDLSALRKHTFENCLK